MQPKFVAYLPAGQLAHENALVAPKLISQPALAAFIVQVILEPARSWTFFGPNEPAYDWEAPKVRTLDPVLKLRELMIAATPRVIVHVPITA